MIKFAKMQGIGNDFVMIDTLRDEPPREDLPALARVMNDRRIGIGGDGLILVERGDSAPFKMRMFNPDGSESEMCGNGIRCLARLLRDHGHVVDGPLDVETGAGLLRLEFTNDGQVTVDMGPARLTRGEIGMTGPPDQRFVEEPIGVDLAGTAVSMGNPHLVTFVDDLASVDLYSLGPRLEQHPLFLNRTNVHFVRVVNRSALEQVTWERGAGATLACGTGACAVAVAANLTGRAERKVEVKLPGGRLKIEYLDNGRVLMTGPAETVFEGRFTPPLDLGTR